jgi:hypothetical protein
MDSAGSEASTTTSSPASRTTSAPESLTTSPPVIMAPRADGFEVVWSIATPGRGWVELQRADAPEGSWAAVACDDNGFVPQGERMLRVRVDGLEPGTDYLVRTVTLAREAPVNLAAPGASAATSTAPADPSDDTDTNITPQHEVSAARTVHTLDPSAETATFVSWNDTHQHADTLQLLDEKSPRADVWIWNGDVCNNWKDPDQIIPTILTPGATPEAPRGLDVTDGRPMAFSWGNHDVRGKFAFQLPKVVATPGGLPYYTLRFGPIAALVLDTGEDKPDHHRSFGGRVAFGELRERQGEWIAEQIRRSEIADAPYRLVFCHMPLRWHEEPDLTDQDYRDGEFDHVSLASRRFWHDPLVAWGAQLVISGHNHEASYLPATSEFPYAQILGGGPILDEATWIEGQAGPDQLTVTVRRLLDGSVAESTTLTPVG